ncbi:hypothetical protein ACJW30_07G110700 [Castanea mollissima]
MAAVAETWIGDFFFLKNKKRNSCTRKPLFSKAKEVEEEKEVVTKGSGMVQRDNNNNNNNNNANMSETTVCLLMDLFVPW